MKEENDFGVVGNIKITTKKTKKKKKKKSNTSFGIKLFVWIMFIAMLASFVAPLVYYLLSAMGSE